MLGAWIDNVPLRKPCSTVISDEEWAFVPPYLTLMHEVVAQRRRDVREVVNALRWSVWARVLWPLLPTNVPL
jgi:transposase